jgi:hypothetical protein
MTPAQMNDLAVLVKDRMLDSEIQLDDGTTVTVRQALERAAKTPGMLDKIATSLGTVKSNVADIKKNVRLLAEKAGLIK